MNNEKMSLQHLNEQFNETSATKVHLEVISTHKTVSYRCKETYYNVGITNKYC